MPLRRGRGQTRRARLLSQHPFSPPRQVQIYNPAFFKYIHDRWTEHHGRYPSTGMLVLFFALHVCDEVGGGGTGTPAGRWLLFPHLAGLANFFLLFYSIFGC